MLKKWVKEFSDIGKPRFFRVFLFDKFSLTTTIFINIGGYDNKVIYISNQSRRALFQH